MTTLDCPVCPDGELTFDVYQDSDGDVAELESQSCKCQLSDALWADLERRAVEAAFEASAPDL